ncbi:MAG: peptidoglycan-binding protein [Nostocaceae cyanobacterium]|nr:peptidoglycan-binding protein [Nostocaceae cyanobacterium]
MENLAYLHVAFTYEDSLSGELVSRDCALNQATVPDWKRLSSRAWKHLLPLFITLSILSVVNSALALQIGDQGPSVRRLQQKLKNAGFYPATITRVYDKNTVEAVRKFQKATGLRVDGIAGPNTLEKLNSWRPSSASTQTKKPQTTATRQRSNTKVVATTTTTTTTKKSSNSNFIVRGNEGEKVRILQERLRVAGFYYGNATGIFGPITEQAVKKFQKAYNLQVDGIVGPATLAKLPPMGIGGNQQTPRIRTSKDQLRLGDRGEAVRVLQAQLIKAGYLRGEPNGYYGAYTTDAIRRFQANNYLAASGIAGPTTRAKLYNSVNADDKKQFSVLEIQRRLRQRGFYKGPLDGKMGNDTKQAIKQAQEFYQISLNDLKNGRF